MKAALVKRATVIFPRRDYLKDSAVRHNRRQWVASVQRLAERGLTPYPGLKMEPVIVWSPGHEGR
jgi:hypothetical protein